MRHSTNIQWSVRVFLIILAFCMTCSVITYAASDSPWLTPSRFKIEPTDWLDADQYNDLLASKRGFEQGQECVTKRINTRTRAARNYKEGCWYVTKIGLLSQDGTYLLEPDTDIAAHIKGNLLDNSILKPTTNPDVFLELQPDAAVGYGYSVRFRRIAELGFNRSTSSLTGATTLEYATVPSGALASSATKFINVQSQQVWYSPDAHWMLAWGERGVLYRTNLDTLKSQAIYVRDKGSTVLTGSAAISPSARYVAVAIQQTNQEDVYVVDTTTCSVAESVYVASTAKCSVVSLKNVIMSKSSGFSKPSVPQFYSDDVVSIYLTENNYWRQYTTSAIGTITSGTSYMALGDSFSSGEGAGNYLFGTDKLKINMCHTSLDSYPYLINNRLNFEKFHSIACSGAKIQNVLNKAQYYNPDQQDILQPGSGSQIELLNRGGNKNNIVTISVSGNDIGFTDIVKACVENAGSCYKWYEKRKELTNRIDKLIPRLKSTYGNIKRNMAPGGRLYVVGYPQVVSPDYSANCGENVKMNDQERVAANDLVTYLNAVIKYSATSAGVLYVGVEGSLQGHRLCDGPSATVGVNGITLGDESGPAKDAIRVLSKGTYHPNDIGHQLLAKAVLEKTNNLTAPMPNPGVAIEKPDAEKTPFLTEAPHQPEPIRTVADPDFDTKQLYKVGEKKTVSVTDPSVPTVPNATYRAELHSDPVVLGSVISNDAGYIAGEFTIPASTPPGLHTLHIIGPSLDGGELDITENIYVGVSGTDFDGDGVLNQDEPCGIFDPSGHDIDGDGVDDACDDVVGEPKQDPIVPAPGANEGTGTPETPPQSGGSEQVILQGKVVTAVATELNTITDKTILTSPAGIQLATTSPVGAITSAQSQTAHVLSAFENMKSAVEEKDTLRTVALDSKGAKPHTFDQKNAIVILTFITLISYSIFIYARKKFKSR